jgi:hypothetical protein
MLWLDQLPKLEFGRLRSTDAVRQYVSQSVCLLGDRDIMLKVE